MMTHDDRPAITYRARRHLWLRPGEHLVCPNGHRLRHNAAVLQHEILICQHKLERGSAECGARAYILVFPGGLRFVAEVTPAEMIYMRDKSMGIEDVIAFLRGSAA